MKIELVKRGEFLYGTPWSLKRAVDSFLEDKIVCLLKSSRREFLKVEELDNEGFPHLLSDRGKMRVERREFEILLPNQNAAIRGVGYRETIPIVRKKWVVYLYPLNTHPSTWGTADDGRCLHCEGWGCWECNSSGGY